MALADTLPTMSERSEKFGRNLKRLREERRLTQPQLARRVGVHTITIAKWEAGDNEPGGRNLLTLSQQLRVSVPSLLGQVRPETEQAIGAYKASAYAQIRSSEGRPMDAVEEEFLRYVIESVWIEGQPTPKALDSILEAARNSPGLLTLPPEGPR